MSETQTPKRKRRVTGPGARESAGSRLSAGVVTVGAGLRNKELDVEAAERFFPSLPVEQMSGAGRPGNGLRRDATATVREPLLLMAPVSPLERGLKKRIDAWTEEAAAAYRVFLGSSNVDEIRAASRRNRRCWQRVGALYKAWRGLVERGLI